MNMKIKVNSPCCICSSLESKLVFEIEYPQYSYPGKFSIRKCDDCGLLFNSPRLREKDLFELYNANYYFFQRHDNDEFVRIQDIYQRTIALFEKDVSEKRVAEIGSGKGYLLALLRELGWCVQGIELSTDASKYATTRFGVPCFNGTIDLYSESDEAEKFPVVMAIDVLEHVPNPTEFMNSIDRIVVGGGLLVIDTPNGMAKNIDSQGSVWKGFNPFHVYLFSIDGVERMMTDIGYTIERRFSYNNRPESVSTNPAGFEQIIKSVLLRLGLLESCTRVYKKLFKSSWEESGDIENLLRTTVKAVKSRPSYLDGVDAKDDLAKDHRGDNIVIVARKQTS